MVRVKSQEKSNSDWWMLALRTSTALVVAYVALGSVPVQSLGGDLTTTLRISIKKEAPCSENIVKLSDVADLSGSASFIDVLQNLPLAPAPMEGKSQRWTKADIQNHLKLRGHSPESFRWTGAEVCEVKRSKGSARLRDDYVATKGAAVNPSQAQRNVEKAILAYLQLQSRSASQWKVKVSVPEQHIKTLNQSRSIEGVAGGVAPWEGNQTFTLLIKSPLGEDEIEIEAVVEAPPMVVAAIGPMRQGQMVFERDLQYVPLTSSAKLQPADCFVDAKEVVGKELRKAVSSGQVIAKQELGPPRVISVGDLIEIEVISGSVTVQTSGKSLGVGGIGDTIQVEVLPHKKKLMAHIFGDRKVQTSASSSR